MWFQPDGNRRSLPCTHMCMFASASACGGQSIEFQTSIHNPHQLERTSQQHGAVSRLCYAHTACRLACLSARHREIILPAQAKSPAASHSQHNVVWLSTRQSIFYNSTSDLAGLLMAQLAVWMADHSTAHTHLAVQKSSQKHSAWVLMHCSCWWRLRSTARPSTAWGGGKLRGLRRC